jgi:hypothetical protein
MSRANISDRVEPGVIVRAGNQEWVIGQIPDGVEAPERIPFAGKKVTDKIVTLSALEEARLFAEQSVRKSSVIPMGQKLARSPIQSQKSSFRIPKILHDLYMQIGALFVRLARRMTRHSSFADSFRSGLIFGLALGCMSLLLFHQVDSPTRSATGMQGSAMTPASGVLTHGVAVPGIHVFGLGLGSYANLSNAEKAAKALNKKGVPGAVVHVGGKYVLLNRIAVTPRDLNSAANTFKKKQVSSAIVPIDIPAHKYPALPSASAADLSQTSSWLASEVSALVTMASFASDGGRQADAAHAYENANALYPSDTVISETGLGVALSQLQKAVQEGNAALVKGDKQGTMICVMRGYQVLLDSQELNS